MPPSWAVPSKYFQSTGSKVQSPWLNLASAYLTDTLWCHFHPCSLSSSCHTPSSCSSDHWESPRHQVLCCARSAVAIPLAATSSPSVLRQISPPLRAQPQLFTILPCLFSSWHLHTPQDLVKGLCPARLCLLSVEHRNMKTRTVSALCPDVSRLDPWPAEWINKQMNNFTHTLKTELHQIF